MIVLVSAPVSVFGVVLLVAPVHAVVAAEVVGIPVAAVAAGGPASVASLPIVTVVLLVVVPVEELPVGTAVEVLAVIAVAADGVCLHWFQFHRWLHGRYRTVGSIRDETQRNLEGSARQSRCSRH